MLKALATGVALLASLAAIGAPASAAPASGPGDDMVIDVAAANGSGCPLGSADVTMSLDNKAFTVTYSQFTAQIGPGTKPTDFRKNCQLALNMHVPQGYTFAIAGADYRGYAHLERGATGMETANYYFQVESQSTRIRHNFTGRADSDWEKTDNVGVAVLPALRRRALPQCQHRTARQPRLVQSEGHQLPDHGLHRRAYRHRLPRRLEEVLT